MSQSTSLSTEQVIESAPGRDLAVEKRSIQMRQFKSKTNIAKCVRDQVIVPLGQIAGVIYDVIEKPGTLPNGEAKTSLLAMGDFQAVNYETGEVYEAHAAYLPGYFIEALNAIFRKARNGIVEVGIEIVAEPTGIDEKTNLPKAIPFAYGVRNLIARRADDPLEALKRRMLAGGMLRLPAPQTAPADVTITLPDTDTRRLVDASEAGNAGDDGVSDEVMEAAAGADAAVEAANTRRAPRKAA